MDQIIRIFAVRKSVEVINQEIVQATQHGRRVLVQASSILSLMLSLLPDQTGTGQFDHETDTQIGIEIDSQNSTVARWAEELAQQHGLLWQRVGPDVFFTRPARLRNDDK